MVLKSYEASRPASQKVVQHARETEATMAEEYGTAAFFEQLLNSMGVKPEKAKQYAESLAVEEYDLQLFGELTAEELKADFGSLRVISSGLKPGSGALAVARRCACPPGAAPRHRRARARLQAQTKT